MSLEDLQVGLRHTHSIVVDDKLTVPAVSRAFTGFADMPPVFATAFVVAFVEWTCIEGLRPFLAADQRTVGVHVDLSHGAATPIGMTVTAEVELVEGRKLRSKRVCSDDAEIVSEGHHDRFVVPRFMARLEKKRTAQNA